jgi:hypothetical protein
MPEAVGINPTIPNLHALDIAQHRNMAPLSAALIVPENYPVCQLACHVPRGFMRRVPVAVFNVDRLPRGHQQNLIPDIFPPAVHGGSRPADRFADHRWPSHFAVLVRLIAQALTVAVLDCLAGIDKRSASVLFA